MDVRRKVGLVTGDVEGAGDDHLRRFAVQLFVVHPTLAAPDITAALGLKPHIAHSVGEPRITSRLAPLPGGYPDTRWRHSVLYRVKDRWFADRLSEFLDALSAKKAVLTELRSTGGKTSLIVQFLGDGYLGDDIPAYTLAKLVDLGLDFGIECFAVPQS